MNFLSAVYPVRDNILDQQPVVRALAGAARALHWPFVALCALGIALALRRGRGYRAAQRSLLRPAAAALLWFTALYAVFLPDPRYLVV